jgi:hypothetical protein
VLQVAFSAAVAEDADVVAAACAALAEAFERCPDAQLVRLQEQVVGTARCMLAAASPDRQYELVALVAAYTQSHADSLVRSGESELLEHLFKAAAVHSENAEGHLTSMHAIEALVALGLALQAAIMEEPCNTALPAPLQGLLQLFSEGISAMLVMFQARPGCVRVLVDVRSCAVLTTYCNPPRPLSITRLAVL